MAEIKDYLILEKQEDGSLKGIHPETKAKNVIESEQKQFISKTEKEKLAGIESGSQVNKVETISINGGAKITPDETKNIDLTVAITAGVKLTYNATTGIVSLLDKDNVVLSSVDLPLELLIESGSYNSATQNIELVLANGEKILIPAGDLVDEYGADGTTITMSNTNTFSIAQQVLETIQNIINEKDEIITEISNIEKGIVQVGSSKSADKLANAREISLIGDATGNTTFDGSEDKAIEVTLKNVGTAGSYSAVTTDEKGRVINGGQVIEIGIKGQTQPSSSLAVGGLFFQEISE